MPLRDQLTKEGFDALIDMIVEDNLSPAGETPPAEFMVRLKYLREFNEGEKLCRYCRKASEHLQDYQ